MSDTQRIYVGSWKRNEKKTAEGDGRAPRYSSYWSSRLQKYFFRGIAAHQYCSALSEVVRLEVAPQSLELRDRGPCGRQFTAVHVGRFFGWEACSMSDFFAPALGRSAPCNFATRQGRHPKNNPTSCWKRTLGAGDHYVVCCGREDGGAHEQWRGLALPTYECWRLQERAHWKWKTIANE